MDEIFTFGPIAGVLAFVAATFALYRLLVSQKEAQIQTLKEQVKTYELQLKSALEVSPDVVVGQFATRVKHISEELVRMKEDVHASEEEVRAKEAELEAAQEEMKDLRAQVAKADELFSEFLCPYCKAPIDVRTYHSHMVEHGGRSYDMDHEFISYECGLELSDGEETKPCGRAAGNSSRKKDAEPA